MNIVTIVRRIGAIPGVQRHALPALLKCVAVLETLDPTERRRRRRRPHPKPPKD